MKDVLFYVFLLFLYGVLALRLAPSFLTPEASTLSWRTLGELLLFFAGVATLARWTVMAFKARPARLIDGQKIVGVEEGEAERVIDVVKPVTLRKEEKSPKLKKRRLFR